MRSITQQSTSATTFSGGTPCGFLHTRGRRARRASVWAPLVGLVLWTVAGCAGGVSSDSGGSGGSGGGASQFSVVGVNVLSGMEWKLNRPIDVTFSHDVDFATVKIGRAHV
jgi:hypothetical protein